MAMALRMMTYQTTKGVMNNMATKTKAEEVDDTSNGNGDGKFRLSISLDPSLRRSIRIAAAYNDMEPGEWCARVLGIMADKAIEEGAPQ